MPDCDARNNLAVLCRVEVRGAKGAAPGHRLGGAVLGHVCLRGHGAKPARMTFLVESALNAVERAGKEPCGADCARGTVVGRREFGHPVVVPKFYKKLHYIHAARTPMAGARPRH